MKTKFLVSLIAILAVLTFVQLTAAFASTGDLNASVTDVNINGVSLDGKTVVDYAGATMVVRVEFVVNEDYSGKDSKVKVWIGGKETEASVKNIALTTGTHYLYMVLKVPTDIDQTEDVTLFVRIETGSQYKENQFSLKIQRETYNIEVLDVSVDKTAKAGDSLPVTVVLKNTGYRQLDDVMVVVSIPELGVEKKAYFEDLTPNDTCDDCNKRDSAERSLTLRIPTNAKAGVYEMRIQAYNAKSSIVTTRTVVIVGAEEESRVIVPVTSKDISTDDSVTYDLVIVNSGSKVGVYEIVPETTSGLSVSTDTPVITVSAGNSQVVKLTVKAVREGTYSFAVGINSDDKLVQRVVLNANATDKAFTGNVAILTIILAIVFVVLLVVLIVLLTRKPMKSEELEESYY